MKTALLDIRGMSLRSLYIGKDPEALQGEIKPLINTAAFGIQNFIDIYLTEILENYGTPQIIAAWDGGNDRRKDLYPNYKHKRNENDKKLDPLDVEQRDLMEKQVKQLLASLGILQVQANSTEADDVIARFCQDLPGEIEVFTVDGDLLQLSQHCDSEGKSIMVNLSGEIFTDEYKEIPLHLIALNKALVGDMSDGYGGIKGFGAAKWKDLQEEYGIDGLEEILECFETENFTDLTSINKADQNKALSLVIDNLDQAKLCYNLAILHPEWVGSPYKKKVKPLTWFKRVPNKQRLEGVLEKAGCLDLLENFEDCLPTYWLIDSETFEEEDVEEAKEAFSEGDCVAFDYESYDPDPFQGYQDYKEGYVDVLNQVPTGASFCFGKNFENCFYVTTNHKDSNNLDNSVIGEFLKAADESDAPVVAHSSQFEIELSKRCAGYCPEVVYDTEHIKVHVDEDSPNNLKSLSKDLMNYTQQTYSETIGDKKNMSELTAEEAAFPYGCDDSVVTAHLFSLMRYQALIDNTWDHYETHTPYAAQTMASAKSEGVNVDKEYFDNYQEKDREDIAEAVGKIHPLLAKYCTKSHPEVVEKFLKEDFIPFTNAKNKAAEPEKTLSREKLDEKIQRETERTLEACIYEAPEEGFKKAEFLPTVAKFKVVTEALGVEPLDGVSANKISNYMSDRNAEIYDKQHNEKSVEFFKLLGLACPEIKDREGDDYDNLVKFCSEFLVDKSKVIKSGTHIDIGSPKFMQRFMYGMLQLPVHRRSNVNFGTTRDQLGLEGSPSTDVDAINYAILHDMVEDDWRTEVLECLKLIKTATTRNSLYFKPYSHMYRETEDGYKLYPTIKLKGTVTRRPSGNTPNILQISSIKDSGRMRRGFLPASKESRDRMMVCIDFSQQELRILASETGDKAMQECYIGEERRDIHTQSALGIYNKLNRTELEYAEFKNILDDPSHELSGEANKVRKGKAKPTNFLVGYGGAYTTLSQRLMIPEKEAKSIFDAVFETYPGIGEWQDSTIAQAKKDGFVATAYGNKRHATNMLFSKDNALASRAGRQLCNSQIQGCAADILDEVLAEYHRQDISGKTGAHLIAPVYDEVVASVPVDSVVDYVSLMMPIMEVTPPGHAVPMVADVSIGWNWGDQTEVGESPSAETLTKALDDLLKIEEEA